MSPPESPALLVSDSDESVDQLSHYLDDTHISTVHNEVNNSSHIVIKGIRMRHLAEITKPLKLANIFEKILDRYIPDRKHALYMVIVKHPGLRKNFVLCERNYETNSGFALVKKLEAVSQSNENFSPDDRMTLELMILEGVADADMTSRGVARSRAPGEAGALVSFVVNRDNLCLPKATAIAMANGSLNHFRKHYNIKNVKKVSHLPDFIQKELSQRLLVQSQVTSLQKPRSDTQLAMALECRDRYQAREALALLRHCKIPSDKLSYNLDDLQKIYENQPPPSEHKGNFPLFSFHVFTPGGALIRAFRHPTQHLNQFPLLFIHDNGHLDYAFDLTHNGLHFCRVCKMAHKRCEHRCRGLCSMCQTHVGECAELLGEKQQCPKCRCIFPNKTCFAAHKKTAATSPVQGASLCTRRKYCNECCVMYHVTDKTTKHQCNTKYCDKCQCLRPKDSHDCTWREFRESELKKIKKHCGHFKMIFYDFETMQGVLDAEDNLRPFTNGHIPILARAAVVCHRCENKPEKYKCKNCGQQREFKFIYEPGQSKSQVVEDFIMHFAGNKRYNNNYLMLAHYASGFDTLPILSHLLSKGIRPDVVHSGTRVLQMTIDKHSFDFAKARREAKDKSAIKNPVKAKLVFKDTLLFTTCALEAFPKAFGIEEQKGFFPFDLISDKYWDYDEDKYPDFKFWKASERYKKDKAEEIRRWYESVKDTPYNFKEELDKYCRNDVTMLKKGVLKFRQAFIDENAFDPFQECMTAASASQFAFRLNHLEDPSTIAHIDERGEGLRDNQSSLALRYLHWRSEKENLSIQTALSEDGEKVVKGGSGSAYKVDGYVPGTKRILEVHGCYWHACQHCNTQLKKETTKVEMANRLARTKAKTQDLRDGGYEVEEVWEHEIKEMLESDADMKMFFEEFEYLERLFPRSAYFGGRTFTSKMIEKCGPLEEIKFFDVNSLYPAMMFKRRYPIGKPKVLKLIRGDFKNDVNPLEYKGLITCRVLVPSNQRFAVLPSRHNGQLYFANCRSCCETEQQICTHKTVEERAFYGTWTHVELEEAVKDDAKIDNVREIWHWQNWSKPGDLFGPFVQKFYRTKIANSGWDDSLQTDEDKKRFLEELKEKMDIDLEQSDIKKNPTLRQLSKILLNSMYGKFGERCVRTCTVYLSDRGEIEKLLRDRTIEIRSCEWIPSSLDVDGDVDNQAIWMVSYKTTKENQHSVRFGNIGLASFITAYARLEILKHIRKAGSAHIYTDTDSVAFKVKEGDGVMDKFKKSVNLHLGGLSDEVKEGWKIVRWVAPSAKCYAYELVKRDDTTQKKYVMKIRGVYLTDENQCGYNFDQFLQDVQEYVHDVSVDNERIAKLYQKKREEARMRGEDPDSVAMEAPLANGKAVHTFRNDQIKRKRHSLISETVSKRLKIHQHKGVLDCKTGTVYPLGYVASRKRSLASDDDGPNCKELCV